MLINLNSSQDIKSEPTDSDLHSEEIQDLLSKRPSFIIRWGMSCIFLVLLGSGLICAFISYPEIIKTTARIESIDAPKSVVANTDGKIRSIFVSEHDQVKAGSLIAFIESTADPKEVIRLSGNIDSLQQTNSYLALDQIDVFRKNSFPNLGDLQSEYQTFILACTTYRDYLPGGLFEQKKLRLVSDLNNLKRLGQNIAAQQKLQQQDVNISQWTFEMNEKLRKDKIISELEYKLEKSKLLNKQLMIPQTNAADINIAREDNTIRKELLELDNAAAQQAILFRQSLNTFKSKIDQWKKIYVLKAPVDGVVTFPHFVRENQQVHNQESICFITGVDTRIFAYVNIPYYNSGKVTKHMEVLIKLDAYPSQEFGAIIGTINFIAPIPNDSGYLASISLPQRLRTTHNKELQFKEGMKGSAEIVTTKKTLLKRFYQSIVYQVNK